MTNFNNFLNTYLGSKFFAKRLEELKKNIEVAQKELEENPSEEASAKLETLKNAEHMLTKLANR